MKYYIDLGAYEGKSIEWSLNEYSDFNLFIGFEPIPIFYKRIKNKFKEENRVKMHKSAASSKDKRRVRFYVNNPKNSFADKIGKGSTLLNNKNTGNIDKNKFIHVETIDFAKYIIDNFNKDDYIVLKIDIEGEEYNLLEHMVETGAIFYINKIYCEWHYHKMMKKERKDYHEVKMEYQKRHRKIIKKLKELGFDVTGSNKKDALNLIVGGFE